MKKVKKWARKENNLQGFNIFLLIILLVTAGGCADIAVPTPKDIIEKPIGTESIKIGMTKEKVIELWGEPDQINMVENETKWQGIREEWVYRARYSTIPVDAGYLSKTKKLYFDGNNLTNIVEEKKETEK